MVFESQMFRSVLTIFLAVFMSACVHNQTISVTDEDEVWQLVWLSGWESPEDTEEGEIPYLGLADGRVQGYGGCNRIAGSYVLTGSQISFSRLIATRRACITGMEREGVFLKALEEVSIWERQGGLLRLYDADKQLLLKMEAVKNPSAR